MSDATVDEVDATVDGGVDAPAQPDSATDDGGEAGSDAGDAESDADPTSVRVLTQHNDNARTGENLAETVLNTANVNGKQFGKLFCRQVDDEIYTQPLIVPGLDIPGSGKHDVLFVATVNDTVYAFDAVDPAASTPLWSQSFLNADAQPPMNTDMTGACGGNYTDYSGHIGIASTPVIDPATQTMYLLARTKENGGNDYVQRLHAISIVDGKERPGSPVKIDASVPGPQGQSVTFDPLRNNQRASLLLSQGVVYIGWASHCDWGPYHGWLMGYDAHSLQRVVTYVTTPQGDEGGIWMSGQGPAADDAGNIYLSTANGSVGLNNDPTNLTNRAQSVMRLQQGASGTLSVATWFTPHDWLRLDGADLDLGSAGVLLVPGTNLAITGGKGSVLYTLDRTSMGGWGPRVDDPSVQAMPFPAPARHLHGAPVYWKGPGGGLVYTWAEYDHLRSFRIDSTGKKLDPVPLAVSPNPAPDGMPGASMSISANGDAEGTGILWANMPQSGDANNMVVPGSLHAFDAANVGIELWNSNNATADFPGKLAKFTSPTIANGKVYLSTFSGAVCVYGLLPNVVPLAAPTGLTATATSKTNATLSWTDNSGGVESGFSIERKQGNVGFAQIATVGQAQTQYVDNTGVPFATYSYRVRALGGAAPSAYSNIASVTLNAGAPAPRLRVTGDGRTIANGATTTWALNDTDFGGLALNASAAHTFTLTNDGNAVLNVSAAAVTGTGSAAFTVTAPPPATVAPGASATFTLTFTAATQGAKPATIDIASDDPDQAHYTFAVSGRGISDFIAWWKLDETTGQTAADSSGSGNDGAGTGITWSASGHIGGAAAFDGLASFFQVADNVSLNPSAITIAAWINPVDWNGNRRILQKGGGDDEYRLLAENNSLKFDIAGVGNLTVALPPVNTWTHVACTYDGTTLQLFVGGALVASKGAPGQIPVTPDPLFIGTKTPTSANGDFFYGLLDDVRLYGRALSAAEIAALAQ